MKKTVTNLTMFLFFILVSCKTKLASKMEEEKVTETSDKIDKTVVTMWENFKASNPKIKKEELPDSDFFHNNEKDANRLASLIIDGKKKASSGLYIWYKEANIDLPKIGKKLIVTDFYGKAKAIIET